MEVCGLYHSSSMGGRYGVPNYVPYYNLVPITLCSQPSTTLTSPSTSSTLVPVDRCCRYGERHYATVEEGAGFPFQL